MKKIFPSLIIASTLVANTTFAQGILSVPATLKEISSQQYTARAKGVASYCAINTNTESAYPDTLVRSVGENFDTVMINFNRKVLTLKRIETDHNYLNSPVIVWTNPQSNIILSLEMNIKTSPKDKMNEVGSGLLTLVTPIIREDYEVNYNCLD